MKTISTKSLRTMAASALVLTMLFPPFVVNVSGSIFGCGFGSVFSWPEYRSVSCRIDTGSLLAEWLFVGLILAVHQWANIANMWNERLTRENRAIDAQHEAVRIIADSIIRHAEEQRTQKNLF